MPPFPVFLANRERLTQNAVHEAIHSWLSGRSGFGNVRYSPSKIRREQVHANVDPEIAFEAVHETTAGFEVQFEFPGNVPHDYYRIQWIESDRNYSVGWHQDDHRNDLGECHLLLDYRNEVADVRPADFLDSHPLNVLEKRLEQLPTVIDRISWEDEKPTLD